MRYYLLGANAVGHIFDICFLKASLRGGSKNEAVLLLLSRRRWSQLKTRSARLVHLL